LDARTRTVGESKRKMFKLILVALLTINDIILTNKTLEEKYPKVYGWYLASFLFCGLLGPSSWILVGIYVMYDELFGELDRSFSEKHQETLQTIWNCIIVSAFAIVALSPIYVLWR